MQFAPCSHWPLSLIGCVFSIEMHYRTSILHRAIFDRQLKKISGKIHCRTNMQESSKLSLIEIGKSACGWKNCCPDFKMRIAIKAQTKQCPDSSAHENFRNTKKTFRHFKNRTTVSGKLLFLVKMLREDIDRCTCECDLKRFRCFYEYLFSVIMRSRDIFQISPIKLKYHC